MSALEYLPQRIPCADGRLRMVRVRGHWKQGQWREETQPDGTVPAHLLVNGRYIKGAVVRGVFQPEEVTA